MLAGKEVIFTLVNARGDAIDVFDATTKEKVVGSVRAKTDASGVFSVSLWPNDRGNISTSYMVEIREAGVKKFRSALPSGGTTMLFSDFQTESASLVGQALGSIIKNNYTATTNPAVGNDNTQGYTVGSTWVNTTTPAAFMCMDAATGAADWDQITN